MLAVGDDKTLYALDFKDRMDSGIPEGRTKSINSIEKELSLYFSGKLTSFKTPISFSGTPFQESVWQELLKISYGKTCSYKEIAETIGNPKACRAVGTANGANKLAIIIPCHRVINEGGKLGGYGGGISHKVWLLDHEKKMLR